MYLISVVSVALKRLWHNKGLALCSAFGLTLAVALISSVPLYADAANLRVLEGELVDLAEGQRRPPFSFMYRYIGAWNGAIEVEDYAALDAYLTQTVPGLIGLPVSLSTRYVKTNDFSLFPASEASYAGLRQPLGWVNFAFVEHLAEHITVQEGALSADTMAAADVVDVLVSRTFAESTGLQVGERYIAFMRESQAEAGSGLGQVQFPVRVRGVWEPVDEAEPFWFYAPSSLENALVVQPETFYARIAPAMREEIYTAVWYTIYDGQGVRTDDVPSLLSRIARANARVTNLLPGARLDVSPVEALESYRWTTHVMTILLYVFAIPILGLVLYFISLMSGLVVARQRGEIAILKSRGTGDLQVLGIYVLEGLLIGSVGLALGLLLGRQLALAIGNTVSFLSFGQRIPLPVVITPRTLRLGLVGACVALLASLAPAMRAMRLSMVTYQRDRARSIERPFWQRYGLDFLLLLPAGYGYYVLSNAGTLNYTGNTGDPFQDPLLFLVPSLALFAISLIITRLFPVIMELLARLTGVCMRSVSVVLAFRQLARASRSYTGSLLLLILTVSLAAFTASMARTLDQSLVDRMYYRYGADYFVTEIGQPPLEESGQAESADVPALVGGQTEGWVFVPVSEHLKVEGVNAASRVGAYRAQSNVGGERRSGALFGIDRLDFLSAAFFRHDFASSSGGMLMNRLAQDRAALLVSPNYLIDHALKVGDSIELSVVVWGEERRIPFVISDAVTYFPTYYPDQERNRYLFVANLSYLFEQMGGLYPYDVWVRTDGTLDTLEAERVWRSADINVLQIDGSREAVEREQGQPERVGVFGLLSVGFIAAAVLTMLGFLMHSFISFRQRSIEFGVLRAIGLSVGQMIAFLGVEQLVLVLTGITAGTGIGVWISQLFVPFLQVGTARNVDIPPFVVLIAWDDIIKIYAVFGVMLLGAVASMIWFLLHLRIFEAVKLGEAV